jgi:hypothetical protein
VRLFTYCLTGKTSKKVLARKRKEFDSVRFMREIRDKISFEICDLSTEQMLEYFKKSVPSERILPSV